MNPKIQYNDISREDLDSLSIQVHKAIEGLTIITE